MQISEFVPKHIDQAPSVYRGCSLKELMVICGVSFIANLLFWVFLLALVGIPMVGVGISILATLISSGLLTFMMQRMKRGRPPYYHLTKIRVWAANNMIGKLFIKTHYIKQSSYWQVGRSDRAS